MPNLGRSLAATGWGRMEAVTSLRFFLALFLVLVLVLGWKWSLRVAIKKRDEFSEKFQTAFDPPSFSENHVADFATKVSMFIMAGLLCII